MMLVLPLVSKLLNFIKAAKNTHILNITLELLQLPKECYLLMNEGQVVHATANVLRCSSCYEHCQIRWTNSVKYRKPDCFCNVFRCHTEMLNFNKPNEAFVTFNHQSLKNPLFTGHPGIRRIQRKKSEATEAMGWKTTSLLINSLSYYLFNCIFVVSS